MNVLGNFGGTKPVLGVKDGKLCECSWKPNCVCSQDSRDSHHVAPFNGVTLQEVREALREIREAKLVDEADHYLRYEFTSRFFRFVDDVEFLASDHEIQVRSASRLGIRDFGVNRKRVESLRRLFAGYSGKTVF